MISVNRDEATQLLAVGICTAVLSLFIALTYSQFTLPRYTATYDQKDAQQVVNLIITIGATVSRALRTKQENLSSNSYLWVELDANSTRDADTGLSL